MVIERMEGPSQSLIGECVPDQVQSFLDFSHRSEVVGRPLAALLANDGARVLSVDIDSIQVRVQRRLGPILFMNQYHYLGVHQTSTGHLFQLFIV